ncbi:hypothetical protein LJC45_05955, partial [Alistipes sp. OttesenSCG-928-B03]|nr:hypothetical protein [Alistipes sp. OttesenSCG-928-B03]
MELPATRTGTANETSVGTNQWVLVFDNSSSGDKKFIQMAQTSSGSVVLKKQANPVRVLIVANAPSNWFNETATNVVSTFDDTTLGSNSQSTGLLVGKTYTQAMKILNGRKAAASGTTASAVPYVGGSLPMTAVVDCADLGTTVTTLGTSGSKIQLDRIVAKIVVDATSATGFTLGGATVIGAQNYGRLYDYNQSNPPTEQLVKYYATGSSGADVTGIAAAVGNTTATNPIYVYEAAAGKTHVIIYGTYNGTAGYYKLALKSKGNSAKGYADGTILPVKRNHTYTVNITNVTDIGYATAALAEANPPSNNITSDVTASDLTGHEIVDNGSYYLGLSNSVFLHWSSDIQRNEVLTTISTNAPIGTAISITKIAGNDGITLSPLTSSAPGGETKIDVRATFTAAFIADGDKKALYSIKVGVLEKQLLVKQYGTLLHVGETESELTEVNYVAAKVEEGNDWLSLAMKDGTSGSYGSYTTEAVNSNIDGGTIKITSEHHKVSTGEEVRFVFSTVMASHSPKNEFSETVGSKTFRNMGGRVKISIGQLKVIEPRFARSNVVLYIDDEGNRILTFAEIPEDHTSKTVTYDKKSGGKGSVTFTGTTAIPANVQGIHFRWGGLIGLSSSFVDASANKIITNYDGNNDVKFWPVEYVAKCVRENGTTPDNVTWKFTWENPDYPGVNKWDNPREVPYLGDPSLPDIPGLVGSVPNTYDALIDKYKTKGYDAEEGYGDICRYITDKGWVEGEWRMPTHQEVKYLLYDETRYAENPADHDYKNDETAYGILYGEFEDFYRNINGEMKYVSDLTILPVHNPLQGDSHCYGFTPMTNARIVGAGITPDDINYPTYLTNPPGTRMVIPAAGDRMSGRHWGGADGGQYYVGGNGYFWTSRT